ncbi:MAG TPA: translation initiation factor IF-3 [Candidatus Cloacimonetes bacterium]|nr:translation initiation factor IF-3 [Candidatus Cloacimonadota bacterium]
MRRGKAKTNPVAPRERINRQIRVPSVRLISETGKQVGVVPISEALKKAETAGLDLVEISPKAQPPVCRIMDFGQYYYQKERKMRDARKKQHIVQVKEVKFGPNTEEHDYQFKKHNAIKFLKQLHKVKFTVRFKGRQLAHKDLGYKLLEKLRAELKEIVDIDSEPKSEGRTISMIVAPKKDILKILKNLEVEEQT